MNWNALVLRKHAKHKLETIVQQLFQVGCRYISYMLKGSFRELISNSIRFYRWMRANQLNWMYTYLHSSLQSTIWYALPLLEVIGKI